MAEQNINNTEIKKDIQRQLVLNEGETNSLTAMPVIDCIPNELLFPVSTTSSGVVVIHATRASSTNSFFHITGIEFGFVKNAACDIASGNLSVVATLAETQLATSIALSPVLTLTAERDNVFIDFSKRPLRVAPGTNIQLANNTFTAGAMVRSGFVKGFYSTA